jgi:uncharacterized membrane protein YhaH (DUF805 family)
MDWMTSPFRKYADFTGRATRREFWFFFLLYSVAVLAANFFDALDGTRTVVAARMGAAELTISILSLLPLLSTSARRLHDSDRSGWWMMLLYLPYVGWVAAQNRPAAELVVSGAILVGFVALVVLFLLPGTPMDNRFGPNPRGVSGMSR